MLCQLPHNIFKNIICVANSKLFVQENILVNVNYIFTATEI